MRALMIVLLVVTYAVTSPVGIKPGHSSDVMMAMINRKLYRPSYTRFFKGPHAHTAKGDLQPAKGQFVCNGKLCRLQPGDEPPGCEGICQYPV